MFPTIFTDYEDNKELKISTVNISMYLLTKLVNEVYFYMGDCLNIDEFKRPTINMKNE